jgi:hypothetical protein
MKESLSIKEQLHESITSVHASQVLDEGHPTDANRSLSMPPPWLRVSRHVFCKQFFHENIDFNK